MFDFNFKGFGNCDCVCKLRLCSAESFSVVIVTEIPENIGTSITNAAELLAEQVLKQFNLEPENTVWIENYPRGEGLSETWTLARFEMNSEGHFDNKLTTWKSLLFEQVELICTGENPLQTEITMLKDKNE